MGIHSPGFSHCCSLVNGKPLGVLVSGFGSILSHAGIVLSLGGKGGVVRMGLPNIPFPTVVVTGLCGRLCPLVMCVIDSV